MEELYVLIFAYAACLGVEYLDHSGVFGLGFCPVWVFDLEDFLFRRRGSPVFEVLIVEFAVIAFCKRFIIMKLFGFIVLIPVK